jgi:hypothetical protein
LRHSSDIGAVETSKIKYMKKKDIDFDIYL